MQKGGARGVCEAQEGKTCVVVLHMKHMELSKEWDGQKGQYRGGGVMQREACRCER
jgi:hypothetical protein